MKLFKTISIIIVLIISISFYSCIEEEREEIKTSVYKVFSLLKHGFISLFMENNSRIIYVDRDKPIYYPVYICKIVYVHGEEEFEKDFFDDL